jgi:hypothetical protein
MTKFLQINVNRCRAAQALVTKTADDFDIDFILSEQNQSYDRSWFQEQLGNSAIVNHSNRDVDETGTPEQGFTWIKTPNIRLYSCYWTPRPDIVAFEDFIWRLEMSIYDEGCEEIVCGDFNAYHTLWGCRTNDRKGELLVDTIQLLGMFICNRGTEPTFQSGVWSSIVDLTFAIPRIASTIINWKVIDTTSLSDHNYIFFSTTMFQEIHTQQSSTIKISPEKLTSYLQQNPLPINLENDNIDELAQYLTKNILSICGTTQQKCSTKKKRSVYWWSPDLNILRIKANHLRQIHQRKRKRYGSEVCTEEMEASKIAKTTLGKTIKRAKEKAWTDLCNEVQKDPWDKPYKLVMGKLGKRSKIPEIDTPGRIQYT